MPDPYQKERHLGEVCELISRGRQPAYVEEGPVRAIGQRCVRDGRFLEEHTRAHDPNQTGGHLFAQTGDVLLNSTGTGTIGRTAIFRSETPCLVDSHVTLLRPQDDEVISCILHEILAHPLTQREIEIRFITGSTNQIELLTSQLGRLRIRVPRREDQQKIANILNAIDDAVLETDAVIEKLRTIHIGIIDDLLTRGLANDGSPRDLSTLAETAVGPRPAAWKVANLGRFVVGAEYGTNRSLGDSSAGIPVLRMNNIQDGEFDLSDLKYAPAHAVERFRLQRNDVLFNRTNSWEHVGKAAIWRRDEPGPAFASYLVRLHCGDDLLPEFLHLWLNWAPVQRAIRQFATPGVQQVNINPTNLRRALIAVPDTLDEQRAIIERVNGVAAAIEDHRRHRAKLSSLRGGLRDDLLTGHKPVVDIREAAE